MAQVLGLNGPYYNWHRWYLPGMGRYMELDPIAVAGGFNSKFGPDWFGYAEGNPLRYSDVNGLTIWKVAYRVGRMAVRYGRELTRGEALRRLMRGQDVATDRARAMRKLSKDASLAQGGPGRCVVEPGPSGMPHGHAAANESGTKRFPGHTFFDPNLSLPWYLQAIDDNDDGVIDADDIIEMLNPFPVPVVQAGPETI